jgi:penicillin-binding protein 2|tara:strand:- start:4077 stop:5849 length:1773 start_codon:yes stop_codon:yes gene_type:complete
MLKIENKADIFHYRTLLFILCLALFSLLSRYFYLQVVDYERHFSKSQVNSIKAQTTYAPRGLILDRSGEILVDNFPTYVLTVVPHELQNKEIEFKKLSAIIGVDEQELNRRYMKYYRGRFLPTTIAKNLTFEQISKIEEMRLDFSGIQYERSDERIYSPIFNDAHFLGYLREVDRDTIPMLDKKLLYRAGELIGWQGVEKEYEKELRFSKGIDYIEVDTYGREIDRLENNNTPAFPGKDLTLTIDANLQRFAKSALNENKGSILISNVETGEILSMVSSPSYDLSLYRGSTSENDWNNLLKNEDNPLLNRTIAGLYPAGSKLKLITVINLIENSLVDPSDSLMCTGVYIPPGSTNEFRCWNESGHGLVDLNKAIAQSCNVYFYETVQLTNLKDWTDTAKEFGFNNSTKIDLPNEKNGLIPDKEFYIKNYGRWGWSERGVLLNLTLGQGDILITPIQALRFINHIASKGDTAQLRLNFNKKVSYYDKIEYSEKIWDNIWKGMFDVVNADQGSGWRARLNNPQIKLYGKTSTAENPHGEPHAWFIGFFDLDETTYSIVVMLENGGGGGAVASPIAGNVVSYFINSAKILTEK